MSGMKNQLLIMVEAIDEVFGEGYAKKNPELVGRVMQAEQTGFAASQISEAFHRLTKAKDGEMVK
jgi:hypothetical protein